MWLSLCQTWLARRPAVDIGLFCSCWDLGCCCNFFSFAIWTVCFLARRRLLSHPSWRFFKLSWNLLIGKCLCACRSSPFKLVSSRQSGALISKNFFFGSSVGLFLDHWELVFYLNMVGEDLRNNLFAILSYRFLNCWFFGPSPGSLSSDVTFSFVFWEYFDRKTFVCLLWPQSLVPIPTAFLQTIWCANFHKLFLRLFSRTLSGPLRIGFLFKYGGWRPKK